MLGGFSQGAVMSYALGLGHGTYDPVIEVDWGRRARETLEAAGSEVVYREYPLPHAVDPRFLVELAPWISSALAARRSTTA